MGTRMGRTGRLTYLVIPHVQLTDGDDTGVEWLCHAQKNLEKYLEGISNKQAFYLFMMTNETEEERESRKCS